jgi:Smr domain.
MGGYLKEVNIKYDLPTASDAVKRVTYNIRNGKSWGAGAIKIIHGYGSGGKGGKIRSETRRYLSEQKSKGFIRDYITGEKFSIFDESTRQAFAVCDDLRRDSDLERHNNGITIIIL